VSMEKAGLGWPSRREPVEDNEGEPGGLGWPKEEKR
jgi:hypothetical protein